MMPVSVLSAYADKQKAQTIEAIKWLIKYRYRIFFGDEITPCPLCIIHRRLMSTDYAQLICTGCPIALSAWNQGCLSQKTFHDWFFAPNWLVKIYYGLIRKRMWKKALPIIEEINSTRFVNAGWTYFEELQFMWEE